MAFDVEKMRQLAHPVSEETRQQIEYRRCNREWLRKSAQIALAVRRELRINGVTQQELAERMQVSPQYVGRLMKGTENLTLDTISKLEDALNCSLIQVTPFSPLEDNDDNRIAVYVFSSYYCKNFSNTNTPVGVKKIHGSLVPQLS